MNGSASTRVAAAASASARALVCLAASVLAASGFALMREIPESGRLGARNLADASESVQAQPSVGSCARALLDGGGFGHAPQRRSLGALTGRSRRFGRTLDRRVDQRGQLRGEGFQELHRQRAAEVVI